MTRKPRAFTTLRWHVPPVFMLFVALTLIGVVPVGAMMAPVAVGTNVPAQVSPQQTAVCGLVLTKTVVVSDTTDTVPKTRLTYSITWRLTQPSSECTVTNLTITDSLKALSDQGAVYVTDSATPAGAASIQGDNLVFQLGAQSGPQSSGIVSFAVTVDKSTQCPGGPDSTTPKTISNTATGYDGAAPATKVSSNTIVTQVTCGNKNLAITQLEVTQAIQSLQETVDLIAGKATIVRLHVRAVSGGPQQNITARLYGTVAGSTTRMGPILPSNPGGVITVRSEPKRVVLNDSFYFVLPLSWVGGVELTLDAELNPEPRGVLETTYGDNVASETHTFIPTPPVRLREYNVQYRNGATGPIQQASADEMFELRDWLRRGYPIDQLIVTEHVLDMTELNRVPDCEEVNSKLLFERYAAMQYGGVDRRTRYYGMVDDAGGFMPGCAAGSPSHAASGPTGSNETRYTWDNDGSSYGDWYGARELAYTYGRRSANFCDPDRDLDFPAFPYPGGRIGGPAEDPERFYGFDVLFRDITVYPPSWRDLMSYCENIWISDYTYEGIRAQLESEGFTPSGLAQVAQEVTEYVLVRGIVGITTGSVELDTFYRFSTDVEVEAPIPGGYLIRLRDADNNVLAEYPFTPRYNPDNVEDPDLRGVIHEAVPFLPATRLIEIEGAGRILSTRPVSAQGPTVQVLAPNGTEDVGQDALTVTWQASDPDGDVITATVLLSTDGGNTYLPLRTEVSGNSVTVPAEELAGTTQAKVQVIVSDGVNTAQDSSDADFIIGTKAPTVQIVTPDANTTYLAGQPVLLSGEAAVTGDGALLDAAYSWSSNLDGVLGAGPSIVVSGLSVGVHEVQLTVTDTLGLAASDTRTITVTTSLPLVPDALIVSPETNTLFTMVGNTVPVTETLAIRNASNKSLAFTATDDAPWLTISPSNGNAPTDLLLSADPTGLASGTYAATVTITSPALPTRTVIIFLEVAPAPPQVLLKLYLPVTRNSVFTGLASDKSR